MDLQAFQRELQQFAEERDWGQFHSPKNLAIALSVEASELLERFQWLSEQASRDIAETPGELAPIAEEMADVAIYLLRLADVLGVDLESAMRGKLARNAEKYPVALAKGNATKYNRRAPLTQAAEDSGSEE